MFFSIAAAANLTAAQKKELSRLTKNAQLVITMRPTNILRESPAETTFRIALWGVLKIKDTGLLAELPQTFSLTVPKEAAAEINTADELILCLNWNKNIKRWQRAEQPKTLKSVVYQPDAYDYVYGQLFHWETMYGPDFVHEVQGVWKNQNDGIAHYIASGYSYFSQNRSAFGGMYLEGASRGQEVFVFRVTQAADVPRVQRELKALFWNSKVKYRIALSGQPSYDELKAIKNKIDETFLSQEKSAFLSQKGFTIAGYSVDIIDGYVDVEVLRLNKEKEALFKKYVIDSPYIRLHYVAALELPM